MRRDGEVFRRGPDTKFIQRGSKPTSSRGDVDVRFGILIVIGEGLVELRRRRLIVYVKRIKVRRIDPALGNAGVDLPRRGDEAVISH